MKKNFEKYYPAAISAIFCVVIYLIKDYDKISFMFLKLFKDDILSLVITIESILFGFLVTAITIVIQMDNKGIRLIKELDRYKGLIGFAKSAIYSSLIVIIYSFLFIILGLQYHLLPSIIWIFLFVYNLLSLFRFINIFFVLSESST